MSGDADSGRPGAGSGTSSTGASWPPGSGQNPARVLVEQATYAYAATGRDAPDFTLGPISFEGNRRELISILGPNASGKSTMLKLLAGMFKPLSGRVQIDGSDASELDARVRAQRVALVQQESALLFPLRVWEYVLQGRYPYGRRLRFQSAQDCRMAENALLQVGADDLRDRWMEQLSGGEKQRVILARALAKKLAYSGDSQLVDRYPMAFLARVYATFYQVREDDDLEDAAQAQAAGVVRLRPAHSGAAP